jgi:hypothetical protein
MGRRPRRWWTSASRAPCSASLAITIPTVLIAVYLKRAYSTGLFLGLPFTIGYISAHVYNRHGPQFVGETAGVALAAVTVAAGAMVAFAFEGLVCVGMAVPLAWLVALPGALLGRAVALCSGEHAAGSGWAAALLAPLVVVAEPRDAPAPRDVVTVVEIDAPPAVVWGHVVTFPELPEPHEWIFRAGLAAPLGARIEGSGVGAVRYCDFTTGSFVEPITIWDEHRRLAFEITRQAPPLRELSPHGPVWAPHLDGYFRAVWGEFRLEPLPGGRTGLVGTTRYVVDMFPQAYWALFADGIVQAIHRRVLRHVAGLAQGDEAAGPTARGPAR